METAMNYQERIVRDPQIVGGEPVLKGTRVTLTYTAPYTGSLVPVNGLLDELKRPVPIRGGPPQPVILIVDGLRHTVPRGTLVRVETRELR